MHGPCSPILAIDLGKFNGILCVVDPALNTHRFEPVQTIPSAVHDLLSRFRGSDPSRVLVVIETCEVRGWVHDPASSSADGEPLARLTTMTENRWIEGFVQTFARRPNRPAGQSA